MSYTTIKIDGKEYTAGLVDDIRSSNGSPGNLFRISETPEDEVLGCIQCYVSHTVMAIWQQRENKITRDTLQELFISLLPHINIPVEFEKIKSSYPSCFTVFISTQPSGLQDNQLIVHAEDSPEKLIQSLVYSGKITDTEVRKQILKVLYKHWQESHNTKLRVATVKSSLYIPNGYFDRNLDYLIRKGYVDDLTQNNELISVNISAKGVEYVENNFQEPLSGVQIVQIMKDQIITNVTGNNNIVNIKGELNQLFQSLEAEVETKNPQNKKEVLDNLSELKSEMEGEQDYTKIQNLLKWLQGSASWIHEKVIKHPVVAQVIAMAVAKQIGLPTT